MNDKPKSIAVRAHGNKDVKIQFGVIRGYDRAFDLHNNEGMDISGGSVSAPQSAPPKEEDDAEGGDDPARQSWWRDVKVQVASGLIVLAIGAALTVVFGG